MKRPRRYNPRPPKPQRKYSDATFEEQAEYHRYKARLKEFNPLLEPQEFRYWIEEYQAVKRVESREEPAIDLDQYHGARNYDLSTLPDSQPVRDKKEKRDDK